MLMREAGELLFLFVLSSQKLLWWVFLCFLIPMSRISLKNFRFNETCSVLHIYYVIKTLFASIYVHSFCLCVHTLCMRTLYECPCDVMCVVRPKKLPTHLHREAGSVFNCVLCLCVWTWFHCTFVCCVYSAVGSEASCDSSSSSGLQQLFKMVSQEERRKYFTY